MNFSFTEEQNMIREMVRNFTDKEVKPLAEKIDKEREVPRELVDKMIELGFMGIVFPEKYDGGGFGEIGFCILLEELSRGCLSTAALVGGHESIGAMAIYIDGTEEQKEKFLKPMARGEKLGCFAMTEPTAGSDVGGMKMSAVEDGDDYVLNGTKLWITNGNIADIISTFAYTDKEKGVKSGISAFIVEKEREGFSVGKVEEKMGIKGSGTAELIFEDVRVPKENLIGEKPGEGFKTAMKVLDVGRLSLAAQSLGASKELLDMSIKFAKERVQFGRPIEKFQGVQWMLAEMATDIFAMENMIYRTAWMYDQNMPITRDSAMVKLFCTEAMGRVADMAVQIHGGMGYMKEYSVERFYRDARIYRIFEGTNEIQKIVIAKDVLKKGKF